MWTVDYRSVVASLLLFTSCAEPGGPQDFVFDLLLTDDTLYAPGYTDAQFSAIEGTRTSTSPRSSRS